MFVGFQCALLYTSSTRRNYVLQPAARLQTLSCQIRPCGQKNMKNYECFQKDYYFVKYLLLSL